MMFRELDATETIKFRDWAQKNYETLSPINPMWHPTVKLECHQINLDAIRQRGQDEQDRCHGHSY